MSRSWESCEPTTCYGPVRTLPRKELRDPRAVHRLSTAINTQSDTLIDCIGLLAQSFSIVPEAFEKKEFL
ncbi:hypothetical protein J6590_000705 [Homalodisca vitripennis]|nr:hypothetical protein J6590_000705 [Homalodisca vitripennis]